jgi:hypothetical protein
MTAQGEAGGRQEGATVPAAAPDDERQLAEEIEQTREQLGETVQALTAKGDVKARAQGKIAQLADTAEAARHKAASVAGPPVGQVRQQAEAAVAGISKITPEPARQAAAKTAGVARQRRVPLAAAAAVTVLAWLIIRWRRR